jgi:hypothetical protein
VPLGSFEPVHVECTGETLSTSPAGASPMLPFNSTRDHVLGLGSLILAHGALQRAVMPPAHAIAKSPRPGL